MIVLDPEPLAIYFGRRLHYYSSSVGGLRFVELRLMIVRLAVIELAFELTGVVWLEVAV